MADQSLCQKVTALCSDDTNKESVNPIALVRTCLKKLHKAKKNKNKKKDRTILDMLKRKRPTVMTTTTNKRHEK